MDFAIWQVQIKCAYILASDSAANTKALIYSHDNDFHIQFGD